MLRVMIVDDDTNVRKCLRKLIPWEEIGCSIAAEASDGVEGLKRFHEIKPDVIITDLKMPEMSGEEFCERIRSVSDSVSIIFLSAYESFSAAQSSLHYGVIEYIVKPIDSRKLAQITEILKRLALSLANRSFMDRLISDPSLLEEFSQQLRCRNAAYFDDFFQNLSVSLGNDFTLFQRNAAFLINLLFDVSESVSSQEQHFARQRALSQLSVLSRKMDIVNYIMEAYHDFISEDSPVSPGEFNRQLVEQIKLYILKNLNQPQLSLSSIAGYFGFSDDYLGRIFKKDMGVSITSYITHLRLNHACRLLKNTRLTIAEIAQSTGYSSTNYFCRSFKKHLGLTPSDYQKHQSHERPSTD